MPNIQDQTLTLFDGIAAESMDFVVTTDTQRSPSLIRSFLMEVSPFESERGNGVTDCLGDRHRRERF